VNFRKGQNIVKRLRGRLDGILAIEKIASLSLIDQSNIFVTEAWTVVAIELA
jgi:hypothetical protein